MTIIKKFEPEQPKNNYSRKFISLAALVFFILILIQIWVSNTVVSYGEKFNKLSALEEALKTENQILENEIANESSLKNLSSKSAELGFSKVESIQYIR